MSERLAYGREQYQEILKDCLPNDTHRQFDAWQLTAQHWKPSFNVMVDLGCGTGNSVDFFRKLRADVTWIGLDIEDSPEVEVRRRSDAEFLTFDGINMPLASASVDLIFCRQVLEHVQHPEKLLNEINRTLKPGGLFIGSVSQLEPYHSFSQFNWTAWAIKTHFACARLTLREVRPGIDGLTLIIWYLLRQRFLNRYFVRESPLNKLLGLVCSLKGRSSAEINAAKLYFSGHICFVAEKMQDYYNDYLLKDNKLGMPRCTADAFNV
jgi:SAM-dependent methyltransferase